MMNACRHSYETVKDLMLALRSGFGFLSTIPVGISMEGIEALMRHVHLFPIVGGVLGMIYAASFLMLERMLPPGSQAVTSILVLVIIYKICGINHIDGLADFGDGVTAHGGTIEKKIQAMKDVNLGTGGGVFIAMILLAAYSAISAIPYGLVPMALVASEISAKLSMVVFASLSHSFQKGFGSMMIDRTGPKDLLSTILVASVLCYIALDLLGLLMLATSSIAAYYIMIVSKRNFGGGSGDGCGASNEICRAVALITALSASGVQSWTPL
jgi:adenosylcobinamide-GDP ribazoletransferase